MANQYDNFGLDIGAEEAYLKLNGMMSKDVVDEEKIGHYHKRGAVGQGGDLEAEDIGIVSPSGITSTTVQGVVDEFKGLIDIGRVHVPRRQTVLQGQMNYSINESAFIVAIAGQLKLNLLATEVPLICTIADGNTLYGQKDYVFGFAQDVIEAWTLPANKSFLQLYIEYNPETKTASFGYTEYKTQYSNPSSPVVGQHWFDKDNLFIMQQWNGTAWDKKLRLFVGEATTDASSVTSVTCYAIQGSSVVISNVLAADQVQTLSHNLGRKPNKLGISLLCISGDMGFSVGDEVFAFPNHVDEARARRWIVAADSSYITIGIGQSIVMVHKLTGASGLINFANWKFKIRCEV